MENFDIIDSGLSSGARLSLSSEARDILESTRKWTKFLAILGFVFEGFIILGALSVGTLLNSIPTGAMYAGSSAFITVFYLIYAIVLFFPIFYLFRFSTNLGTALKNGDGDDLTRAFSNLKAHYKFLGILSIIFIALFVVTIVGVAIGATALS